ncbi:hypothetical protein HPB50_014176 [Hyalomma asiaticum]|uniref:Uncharacterized protein n=1 Tax=Hyalomma asiaticum TaxID=266040 RepID=A0ACB7SY06_HYAAI|nr:hypothetical protein HPB50_014176 [Hyalomma asiaticum]
MLGEPSPSGTHSTRAQSPQRPSILRTGCPPSRDESFPPLGQPPQHERASRSRSRTCNRSRSRSKSRSTSHHFVSSSYQGPSTSVAFPPGLAQGSSQCSSGPTKVAWGKGLPCSLKSSPQDPSPDTQWNCRGYRKKRSHLQQPVKKLRNDQQASTESVPDVIALQETSAEATLHGYTAYQQLGPQLSPCTSTLVHSSLTATQLTYALPYLRLLSAEKERINRLIWKVY